jgi:hypothetical protein
LTTLFIGMSVVFHHDDHHAERMRARGGGALSVTTIAMPARFGADAGREA